VQHCHAAPRPDPTLFSDFWARQLFVFIDEIALRRDSGVNRIAKVLFKFGVILLELVPMPDGVGFLKFQVREQIEVVSVNLDILICIGEGRESLVHLTQFHVRCFEDLVQPGLRLPVV
jgi:hypothetical protein